MLHTLVIKGFTKELSKILKQHSLNPDLNLNEINDESKTPIHLACELGHLDILKVLLAEKRAYAYVTDGKGRNPLHYAVIHNQIKIAEYLLSNKSESKLLEYSRDAEKKQSPFVMAICLNRIKFIPIFLKNNKKKKLDEFYLNDDEFLKNAKKISDQLSSEDNEEIEKRLKKSSKKSKLTVQVASDLHIEIYEDNDDLSHLIKPSAPYLFLLGDIGLISRKNYKTFLLSMAEKFEKVVVIAGNHEYYGMDHEKANAEMKKICALHDNLVYGEKNCIKIKGINILTTTLWSNVKKEKLWISMCLNDYHMIEKKSKDSISGMSLITVDDTNQWHKECLNWMKQEIAKCKKNNEKCIVMTHHGPLKNMGTSEPTFYDGKNAEAFTTDLSKIVIEEPSVIGYFYGHTHWFQDLTFKNTRIVSNPYGYKGTCKSYDNSFTITFNN